MKINKKKKGEPYAVTKKNDQPLEIEDEPEFEIQPGNAINSNTKLMNSEPKNEKANVGSQLEETETGFKKEKMKKNKFFNLLFNYSSLKNNAIQSKGGPKNSQQKLGECDLLVNFENSFMNGEKSFDELIDYFGKNFKEETIRKLASGELQLELNEQNFFMHILNYYAYMRNYEFLKFLFGKFNGFDITLKKDCFGKNLLDIGVFLQDESLLILILSELINSPPPFDAIEGLSSKLISNISEFHIELLGNFLDSRLFLLRNSRNGIFFNGSPKDLRLTLENELPPNRHSLEAIGVYDYNFDKLGTIDEKYTFFKKINRSEAFVIYVSDIHNIYESNCGGKRGKKKNSKAVVPEGETSDYKDKWYSLKLYETIFDYYASDENLYSSMTLMAIADRKWKTFGRKVFIKEILYTLGLILYYATVANILDFVNNNDHGNFQIYILLFVGYFIIATEFFQELSQMIFGGQGKKGVQRYMKNVKNLIDMFYLFTWALFVGMNSLVVFTKCTIYSCYNTFEWFFIIRSMSNLALCIRVIWLLQVNIRFGFMIRVIVYSAKKTFFFFIVFIILIIGVVVSVGGLKYEKDDWLKALSLWIQYFFYTYKLALGDFGDFFQLQEDDDNSPKSRALFIYFFLSTAILTVILLNLLISILGESYSNVREREKNYIYSATHYGLYAIEKNYSLKEDSSYKYESKRTLSFAGRFLFFFKFLVYLIFRQTILTRYANNGKYMIFVHPLSKTENEEMDRIIKAHFENKTPGNVNPKLKYRSS